MIGTEHAFSMHTLEKTNMGTFSTKKTAHLRAEDALRPFARFVLPFHKEIRLCSQLIVLMVDHHMGRIKLCK